MSNVLFERPAGTAWTAKWIESHSTLIHTGTNPGYDTRVSLGPDPLRTLELQYAILKAGTLGRTRDQLLGFYNLRGGDFDSFLVDLGALTANSIDSTVTGQVLNYDSNGYAPIQVTRYVSSAENWQENIYELAGVNGNPGTAPTLYMNGSLMMAGTDYTIQGPGYSISGETFPGLVAIITLARPPGAVVTANFSWYYRVRFEQPTQEIDMFYHLAWKSQQVRMMQTRT